jgi:hypothetical protein
MGDVITLRSIPTELTDDEGRRFVVDCVRAAEGLLDDSELQRKYELTPSDWINLPKDTALMRAIQAEKERRVLNGTAARESAAKHFVRAPTILAGIMENELSNPRHVIESAREIRAIAAVSSGTEGRPDTDKFIIHIDLGDQVIHHELDQPVKPDVSNEDSPNNLIALEGKPDVNE